MTATQEIRRLTKSRTNRMIDGVCGGIAEYFGVDATLVRLAWVLLTMLGGSGILLYIAGMILIPKGEAPVSPPKKKMNDGANIRFWGFLLIGVGVVWLAANLGVSVWRVWWSQSLEVVIPVALMLLGVAFLFGGRTYVSAAPGTGEGAAAAREASASPSGPRRLYRSRTDRKLAGVCGGIGTALGIDPVIVRLLVIVAALASFGFMLIAYVVMAIVIPAEPEPAPVVVPPSPAA